MGKDFVEIIPESQLKKIEVDLLPNVTGCSYYFLNQLAEKIDNLDTENKEDEKAKHLLQKWINEEEKEHLRDLFSSIVEERGE